MKFSRIDLSKTNYAPVKQVFIMSMAERDDRMDQLKEIYRKYCIHKQFESVVPLFEGMIFDKYTDVIGYYPDGKLAAFSLVKRYDRENAEALQFAWDYNKPELRLGIESLKHECAYYKQQGFKYLYLGLADDYKSQLDGYEILGPL
jgi:hypothetical protein